MYAPAASREPFSCARLCSASCLPPGRRFRPRHFAEECGDSFRPSAGVSCRANRVSSIWRRAACFRIYFLLTLTSPKILRLGKNASELAFFSRLIRIFDFAEDTSSTDSETADKFDRHIRLARSRHGVSACEKVFFICRIIHIIKFVLYIRGDTFFISPPCRKRGVSSRSEEGRRRPTG